MTDISIDLETLGTRYDAPVLAIGACVFNRNTSAIGKSFYAAIETNSALQSGRVSGSTIEWWMRQSDAARKLFVEKEKHTLATALFMFNNWVRDVGASDFCVWGNGATFDISILEHAFDKGCVGIKEPWHFTKIRDMRTIVDVTEHMSDDVPVTFLIDSVGTHHNAKDDAIYQAKVIAECFKMIKSRVPLLVNQVEDDEL